MVAELYVSSGLTNEVKRYDGATGAFLGNFVTAGSGGLSILFGGGLGFGPDGNLYVSNRGRQRAPLQRSKRCLFGEFSSMPRLPLLD